MTRERLEKELGILARAMNRVRAKFFYDRPLTEVLDGTKRTAIVNQSQALRDLIVDTLGEEIGKKIAEEVRYKK